MPMTIRPLLAAGFLLFVVGNVMAQPGPPPDQQRPFERIERWRKVRLLETLNLNEEQSARFIARLNEHDEAKRKLLKEKMDAIDKIERLVLNHASDKEFESVFPEVMAADDKITEEERKFFDGLSDILTNEQRGKLILFKRQFELELRQALREVQRRRHGDDGQ